MTRRIFVFDPPDRFVAGAVGQPGQRTFYLQARGGENVVSVVLEKAQVAVLADRLAALLEELRRRGVTIPTAASPGTEDEGPLEEPLTEAFRTGTLSIAWDTRVEEIILEARAIGDDEDEVQGVEEADDNPNGPDLLRVRLTPTAVLGFVRRAERVIAAGRPPCPWCGQPLDPQGHFCPRRNGGRAN
jgi:uncharacterized repeat protein (TIGR03847 family)